MNESRFMPQIIGDCTFIQKDRSPHGLFDLDNNALCIGWRMKGKLIFIGQKGINRHRRDNK
jgi:hypothetical protein